MKGFFLKFYTHEFQKHHGILMYEWLLELARNKGIHGGSAFRGIAGFGRHGKMHEEHFFELASDVPVEVEFIVTEEEKELILSLLQAEKLDLFYTQSPIEYGSTKE